MKEELGTLAEFYADAATRKELHYSFAHIFLPKLFHQSPLNFVLHDTVPPTLCMQAHWGRLETSAGLRRPHSEVFHRLTDLEAWSDTAGGHPALIVKMPPVEDPTCAYFVAGVLLEDAALFQAAERALGDWLKGVGVRPSDGPFARLRAARGRYFTLEKASGFPGKPSGDFGVLCEWANEEHLNTGRFVRSTREDFRLAVQQQLLPPPTAGRARAAVGH